MQRRQFLAVIGTGATAALAGCAGEEPSNTEIEKTETETATQEQKQATTEQPTAKQTTTEEERETDRANYETATFRRRHVSASQNDLTHCLLVVELARLRY